MTANTEHEHHTFVEVPQEWVGQTTKVSRCVCGAIKTDNGIYIEIVYPKQIPYILPKDN